MGTVKVRVHAKEYQDPDLRNGDVGNAGRVSRISFHLQMVSVGALEEWPLGAWISRAPFSGRRASIARSISALQASGTPRMAAGIGDCRRPRLALVMPQ